MNDQPSPGMPDNFDRRLSGFTGLPEVMQTKASTIPTVDPILGTTQTFIVQTVRKRDERERNGKVSSRAEDHIFLQAMARGEVVRLVLPPKVADTISRQRDSLTARQRSKTARAVAADRKARGEVPGFMRKRKK